MRRNNQYRKPELVNNPHYSIITVLWYLCFRIMSRTYKEYVKWLYENQIPTKPQKANHHLSRNIETNDNLLIAAPNKSEQLYKNVN